MENYNRKYLICQIVAATAILFAAGVCAYALWHGLSAMGKIQLLGLGISLFAAAVTVYGARDVARRTYDREYAAVTEWERNR